MKLSSAAGCLALACLMPGAQAHILLETPQAPVGGAYKATLQVGHGCQGSDTTRIRVRIPDGVLNVKPQPKAGWTLELTQGRYDKPQMLHGTAVKQGVREISWTGDLPDAGYDEFTFHATLSSSLKPGQTLYFPVVQECKQGVSRWIDTSGSPQAEPAPSLKLTAPVAGSGHHH